MYSGNLNEHGTDSDKTLSINASQKSDLLKNDSIIEEMILISELNIRLYFIVIRNITCDSRYFNYLRNIFKQKYQTNF